MGGGGRVVLVLQSAGTALSIQDVVELFGAVVNHIDMTVADSDPSLGGHIIWQLEAHNPPESTASQRTDLPR